MGIDKTIIAEMTSLQKGMLYESLAEQKSVIYYQVQMHVSLNESIQPELMRKAWEKTASDSACLRSCVMKDHLHLRIDDTVCVPWEFIDLSALGKTSLDNAIEAIVAKDQMKKIDIYQSPLFRLILIKKSSSDFILLWTRHHLLMDGITADFLLKRVLLSYQQLGTDSCVQLQPAYYEYKTTSPDSDFWKLMLTPWQTFSLLPAIETRGNTQSSPSPGEKSVIMGVVPSLPIVDLASQYGVTKLTVLLALFAMTFRHYTLKDKLIFGIVRALPRHLTSASGGMFVNTLPLGIHTNEQEMASLLRQISVKLKQVKSQASVSIAQIKQWLALNLADPLFQIIIDYKPYAKQEGLGDNEIKMAYCTEINLTIPYPIVIEIRPSVSGFRLKLYYDSQRFERDTLQHLVSHMELIARGFAKPLKSLCFLPSIDDEAKKKLLSWENTKRISHRYESMRQWLSAAFSMYPDNIALVADEESLTYRELDKVTDQFAAFLSAKGVGVGDRVVLFFPFSKEFLISILSIIKLGAVYVPIDPKYASDRIAYMLDDSLPKLTLTTKNVLIELNKANESLSRKLLESYLVLFDAFWELNTTNFSEGIRLPSVTVSSQDNLYILYTSGSTGRPKAVLMQHLPIVNLVENLISLMNFTQDSRLLQLGSPAFDATVPQWACTLCSGGTLYLSGPFDPIRSGSMLENNKISHLIAATSILEALDKRPFPDLKYVLMGGEVPSASVVAFFGKQCTLFNGFGLTETGVCNVVTKLVFSQHVAIIGKPLANCTIRILNEKKQLVPIGMVGEIYLGGLSLAKGYWNQEVLTKEHFVNLTSDEGDMRFYKTGDLGRWLPNGELAYIGRKDDQIKIGGVRISLNEVKSIIENLDDVLQVYLQLEEEGIVAYIRAKPEKTTQDIRLGMQEKMPEYMQPQKIYILQKIPLTANGKVDRNALSSYRVSNELKEQKNVDIDNKTMQVVHQIFQQVLPNKEIVVTSNFSDMGISSIQLITLSTLLAKHYNIALVDLFRYTTIEKLVTYIETNDVKKHVDIS